MSCGTGARTSEFYLPGLIARLVADSKVERAAARVTIVQCFPELAAQLDSYTTTADLESCRRAVAPLLSKYPQYLGRGRSGYGEPVAVPGRFGRIAGQDAGCCLGRGREDSCGISPHSTQGESR
jgi:hypothetical protein